MDRDILVTMPLSYRGWIMEAIATESARALGLHPHYRFFSERKIEMLKTLPHFKGRSAKNVDLNVFMHHRSLFKYSQTEIPPRSNVFLTHLDEGYVFSEFEWSVLRSCNRVIVQNTALGNFLVSNGLDASRVWVGYGGVDRRVFYPAPKFDVKERFVLIVGDCKPRKNPLLVRSIIQSSPELKFVIHGRGWETQFSDLIVSGGNLKILSFQQNRQPELIRDASTLLSLSSNEGGPFPVIEALASGTPVIASQTGFCGEFINSGNGKLLSKNPTISEIRSALIAAINLKESVASTDLLAGRLTWKDFGQILYSSESKSNFD